MSSLLNELEDLHTKFWSEVAISVLRALGKTVKHNFKTLSNWTFSIKKKN